MTPNTNVATGTTPSELVRRSVPMKGVLAYIALTFLLTLVPTWLLRGTWLGEGRPLATRLLTCSLLYGVSMGWQPFAAVWVVRRWIDPPGYLDHGFKRARFGFTMLAWTAPLVLAALAMLLALLFGTFGVSVSDSLSGDLERELMDRKPDSDAVWVTLAFAATTALIWIQCASEEIGWRGFFMARLMQRLGPWRGLLLHGFVWGTWYAPVLLLLRPEFRGSSISSGSFVITCALLGTLLGWLRLASNSVMPAMVANSVLTLVAGLPFLLHGDDVGLRGSAYGPPGCAIMLVAIVILVTGRWGAAVVTPPTEERCDRTRIRLVTADRGSLH